jgi:hypothetical protein
MRHHDHLTDYTGEVRNEPAAIIAAVLKSPRGATIDLVRR